MGILIQYYQYELVLTSAECSTFYRANVTQLRKTLKQSVTKFSIIWSVTIIALDQMGALIQYYNYELVLTSAEYSTFYGANEHSAS